VKAEWRLFAGAGAFLFLTSTIYWFVTYEHAGTALLGMGVAAVLMVAGWLAFQAARLPGPRPEDRTDADPSDGAGDLGYFPASSIWPLVLGAGGVLAVNGFVFGVWLGLAGGVLILIGIVGYASEASSKL
jgi:hypothetical protein